MSASSTPAAARPQSPLPQVPNQLREIWVGLKPEQAREVFSVAVLGHWPAWIIQRAKGEGLESHPYRRRRKLLESRLDAVAAHGKASNHQAVAPALAMARAPPSIGREG